MNRCGFIYLLSVAYVRSLDTLKFESIGEDLSAIAKGFDSSIFEE